jgi:hypothetical protein
LHRKESLLPFERRRQRILLLILSLDDPYPDPRGARLDSAPGPQPSRSRCKHCQSTGRIFSKTLGKNRYCPLCLGSGWRRGGPEKRDPYVADEDDNPTRTRTLGERDRKTMDRHTLERTLEALRATERARRGLPNPRERYGWESALERQRRLGSYGQLRYLLELMPDTLRPRSDAGLDWLTDRWIGPVRLPPWLEPSENGGKPPEPTLEELQARGLSPTKIAKALGLTRSRVQELLGL